MLCGIDFFFQKTCIFAKKVVPLQPESEINRAPYGQRK